MPAGAESAWGDELRPGGTARANTGPGSARPWSRSLPRLFLARGAASGITGTLLSVDGGTAHY